jgi:hypothetical protein
VQTPLLFLRFHDAVRCVDVFLGFDVEPVVVEKVHRQRLLGLNDGNRGIAAEPDEQRDRTRLHDLETEEFLVEFARALNIARIDGGMREEVELERGFFLGRAVLGDVDLCAGHRFLL